MPTERHDFGPGSSNRARPLPLWQTILVLAIVGGVYWLTREPVPDEVDRPGDRPAADRPSAERPSRRQNFPSERIEVGGKPQPGETHVSQPPDSKPPVDGRHAEANWTVPDVVVRDRDDLIVWRGTVDLTKTIARINAGRRLRYADDGSVFENRERRLPRKKSGYYHEYMHLTPGLPGPGPQRVVRGAGGEIYYTADHYRTFITIRGP